jgi:hypothetical protein
MAVNRGWHYNLSSEAGNIILIGLIKITTNPAGNWICRRPDNMTKPAIQAEGAEFEGFPEHQIV